MYGSTNLCGFMAYTDAVNPGAEAGTGAGGAICDVGDPFASQVLWYFKYNDDLVDAAGHLTGAQTNTRFASDGPYGLGEKCLETNYSYSTPSYAYETAGDTAIGTGDFTMEIWCEFKPWHPLHHYVWEEVAGGGGQYISYVKDGATFGFYVVSGRVNLGADLAAETWHWLVFQRESGTIHTWINGTKHATTISDSTDLDGFSTGRMGGSDPAYYMRVAEHRCTKAARYDTAGNIAVPTAPYA